MRAATREKGQRAHEHRRHHAPDGRKHRRGDDREVAQEGRRQGRARRAALRDLDGQGRGGDSVAGRWRAQRDPHSGGDDRRGEHGRREDRRGGRGEGRRGGRGARSGAGRSACSSAGCARTRSARAARLGAAAIHSGDVRSARAVSTVSFAGSAATARGRAGPRVWRYRIRFHRDRERRSTAHRGRERG